jgi:hypothetical protein
MNTFGAPQRGWWLWAMPLAWATSALLILGESARDAHHDSSGNIWGFLGLLVCCSWLSLGWKVCAGPENRVLARRAVVGLLAVVLPVQGLIGIAVELRGPAHFHAHENPAAHHGHAHVERHYHAALEDAVAVDDGDAQQAAAASVKNKRGAFGSLDASTAAAFIFPSHSLANAIPSERATKQAGHVPCRLERPPRLSSTFS